MHNEQQVVTNQLRLGEAQAAQPLGAGPLHEFKIIDVVNDAARVGVFVVNPTPEGERLSM